VSSSVLRVALLHDDRSGRQAIVKICTADLALAIVVLQRSASAQQIIGARPDVLLIDSRLGNALGICSDLGYNAALSVIFIDVPRDGGFAAQALTAGARGLVFEDEAPVEVLRAIRMVHLGGVWAPRNAVLAALRTSTHAERERREAAARMLLERLSPREIEVMRHAAAGLATKELAERLSISRSTVKAHLTHIFQKLGIQGRVELAAAYHRLLPSSDYEGLIRPGLPRRKTIDVGH
jgi:DNA-binding NarL/FixJ family response regulator